MDYIYLDNSATTRAFDCAVEEFVASSTQTFVNASAPYALAIENDKKLARCKKTLADSIGAGTDEIFFTSGGTESDNTAVFGAVAASKRQKIVITAGEHPAVYEAAMRLKAQGVIVEIAPLLPDGRVDADELVRLAEGAALVAVMHVNNETGAINPVAEISKRIKQKDSECIVFSDGVQAHLRVPCNINTLGVDAYAASAHKVHAVKGVGLLYIKKGCKIKPLLYGGGQQDGFRPGTINLPAISAYATACSRFADGEIVERIALIKQTLINDLQGCVINAASAPTAPHILSVAFQGIQASTLQNALERQGVIVGKGSACSSRNARVSRVLTEMKLKQEVAAGTIRLSIGAYNTVEEAHIAAEIINNTASGLIKFRRR